MPKYTAVAPTFTPLDYKTRIAPLEQYKEEYDKRMDALDEQGVLADAIGGLIDDKQDPELARIYNDYNDKMISTAQDLLRTGDLGSSRRALGELRRDYANKLIPIQQAYNTRAEAGKAYRDAKRKDPSYIGVDPLTHSLSDYMHGNMPDDKYVSGNQLYDFAMKDTAAASARNVLYGKWGLDKDLLSQYFGRQIITGFSEDEVGEALKYYMTDSGQDPSQITGEDAKQVSGALRAIQGAVNRTMSKADGLNGDSYNQALGYALQGAITGIGYKKEDDYKSYDPAFWAKAEKGKRELGGEDYDDLPYSLVPLTEITGAKEIARAKDDLNFLGQMKANPSQVMRQSSIPVGTAGGANVQISSNMDRIAKLAKKYNVDIEEYGVTNQNGTYIVNNASKLEHLIDRVAAIAHQEASVNIPVYNTTKDDNLIDQINKRSITSKDVKKENRHGVAEYTGEELPSGGTFRLNPYMKGSDVYYEYVVRNGKGGYDTYHVGPDSVDSTVAGTLNGKPITYTEYWLRIYKDSMKNREYDKAQTAMHNAMILAYGSAEQKAKVRSTTDSKL